MIIVMRFVIDSSIVYSLTHSSPVIAMPKTSHVLISGAGPVGLVSALVLATEGIQVTVVEAATDLNHDLRASTFHPPTLDMLARYGLTDALVAQGLVARYTQQRDRSEGVIAEFDMTLLTGLTDHPFRLQCEQWKLTEQIKARLDALPHVRVLMGARVESVAQTGDRVEMTVSTEGESLRLEGDYLIGADGARSVVRKSMDIDFEGYTYPERFLVISTDHDFAADMPGLSYVNYCSDPEQWCVLLKVPSMWRVLFPTPIEPSDEECLSPATAESLLQRLVPKAGEYHTFHRSLYKVHQRVAQRFRRGRVFLAGDAAHINNPLGGMGMNGGIHDAVNLCGKLLAVMRGEADDASLDRYERQRRTIAIEYINASTARNKLEMEERDPVVRRRTQDALRATASNPETARAYLRKTSMLDALDRAAAIA
jgi:3-(3-hydroxy-phenyl)propionate hydroxylase